MSLSAQPPLPPPPILTPPVGWIGLLAMKSSGVQPGNVTPALSPTQEMTRFYQAGSRKQLCNAAGLAVALGILNFPGTASVPQGKVWIVEYVTFTFTALGAVAAARIAPAIINVNGTQLEVAPYQGPFLTGEAPVVGLSFTTPRIMLPSDQFALSVCAPAALTVGTTVSVVAVGAEVSA